MGRGAGGRGKARSFSLKCHCRISLHRAMLVRDFPNPGMPGKASAASFSLSRPHLIFQPIVVHTQQMQNEQTPDEYHVFNTACTCNWHMQPVRQELLSTPMLSN